MWPWAYYLIGLASGALLVGGFWAWNELRRLTPQHAATSGQVK